jgi:hypothetical protein
MTEDHTGLLIPTISEEDRDKSEFLQLMEELNLPLSELAQQMRELGDFRLQATILRALQRVQAGQTAVSGELFLIVKRMAFDRRRYQRENKKISWVESIHGGICATVRGFNISLYCNKNGLWQIHVVHIETGYSHPFPRYPNTLEAAKIKALACIDEAEDVLARLHPESQ